jgi:hypothetical protein
LTVPLLVRKCWVNPTYELAQKAQPVEIKKRGILSSLEHAGKDTASAKVC